MGRRPFGIYVHVPFCRTRCGYCDFNTYTATELGPGVSRDSYAGLAVAEVRLARRVLGAAGPPVSSVFFGGGTPTLLPPAALAGILRAIDGEFGLAGDAEVTVEANPETVDERALAALRAGGMTRISLGMQSAMPHVLAVLDRVHEPGRPARCARWAREAGFPHVSLDLIYGTPGESDADWREALAAALAAGPEIGAGGAPGRRYDTHLAGHAERHAARAGRAGPRARARPAGAVRAVGARGRVPARQPGPDLRHPGRERRRLAGVAGGGPGGRPRPHLRLRADRRGGYRAGGADRPGGRAGPRRRRDGRPLPDRR